MQEMQTQNKKRKRTNELVVLSHFFCISINVDIFAEFLAFDEKLNEVAQALDEAVSHLSLPTPDQVLLQQDPTETPYHT